MAAESYNDDQLEFINLIKETSNNSLELIDEILEVTNDGSSDSNMELVEINSLLNNSVGLLRFKAAEKNQVIIFEGLRSPEDLIDQPRKDLAGDRKFNKQRHKIQPVRCKDICTGAALR